jgi:hypothetical protein
MAIFVASMCNIKFIDLFIDSIYLWCGKWKLNTHQMIDVHMGIYDPFPYDETSKLI